MNQERRQTRDPQLRLFVAAELPESWIAALGTLQDTLRGALDPALRLRWVRPEAIHLTLKFVGEVPESRRASVESALNQAVPEPPNLIISLHRIGVFSDRRAPRVVWAGLTGDTVGLIRLAQRIDTWLHASGFRLEKRGLTPHLTLARIPYALPGEGRQAFEVALAAAAISAMPSFTVERVSLMRSNLGPGGARYERLAVFPS